MDLGVESHAFLIHLSELAGEHDSQLGPHLVAQPGIALGLAGLALERVHLPRYLFENVVHAVEISFGIFAAWLCCGLNLRRRIFRTSCGSSTATVLSLGDASAEAAPSISSVFPG